MTQRYAIKLPTAQSYANVLGFLADNYVKVYTTSPGHFMFSTGELSKEQGQYIHEQGGEVMSELKLTPDSPSIVEEMITLYALKFLLGHMSEQEEWLKQYDGEGVYPHIFADVDPYAVLLKMALEKAQSLGIETSNTYP